MTINLPRPLAEATRLTREGRLAEATTLLRDQLGGALGSMKAGVAPAGTQAQPGMLDRLRGLVGGVRAPNPGPLPTGARFEERRYAAAAGARPYKLYVPSSYRAGRAVPLLVMLHGCKQNPDDFAAGTRMNEFAESEGFLVAYPGQISAVNAALCWNWFETSHQRRDFGEASLLAGITREVMAEFAVDADRVYVAGLSAGGAAAAIMGAAYPDLFAAIGVHSGLACGAARDMNSAFSVMRDGPAASAAATSAPPIPAIVFHGDADRTVNPSNGDAVTAQALGASDGVSAVTEQGRSPGGVAYTRVVRSRGGHAVAEHWTLHGSGHAWAGGSADGSYTDPRGPDASRAMVRFFNAQRRRGA